MASYCVALVQVNCGVIFVSYSLMRPFIWILLLFLPGMLNGQNDTTKRGQGRGKAGIFFKRYFDLRNSGSERKYRNSEKNTDRLAFPFDSEYYHLVFEDNFDSLNTNVWGIGQPWGRFHAHYPHQYYGDSVVFVKEGKLHLQNRYAPAAYSYGDSTYTIPYATGLVNTYHSGNFTYGYFAIRSKNPTGPATWPAFWLTGRYNWPPEIDIFEMYGKCSGDNVHVQTMTLHFGKIESNSKTSLTKKVELTADTDTAFHIYSCLWEPGKVSFFTDGVLLKEMKLNQWMEQFYMEPMYVVLNNAIDHNYLDCIKNEQLPNDFVVDWIRIYQKME